MDRARGHFHSRSLLCALPNIFFRFEERIDQAQKDRRANFYFQAATIDYFKKDFDEALRHLDRSKFYNPNNYSAFKLSGQIFFERNQFKKAFDDWSRALQLPNGDQSILRDVNTLKKLIRHARNEIDRLKKSVFLKPDDLVARAKLKELESQMRN
ncbi:hypothetical protein HYY75_02370 [bacterium]|nr:hypothetical protein [bacterium]